MGILVDGRRLGASWVEQCDAKGCESEILLDTFFLPALKRGSKLSLVFHDAGRKRQTVTLSLRGFSRAYEALQAQ
jgi:invasion protein IalB